MVHSQENIGSKISNQWGYSHKEQERGQKVGGTGKWGWSWQKLEGGVGGEWDKNNMLYEILKNSRDIKREKTKSSKEIVCIYTTIGSIKQEYKQNQLKNMAVNNSDLLIAQYYNILSKINSYASV